MLSPTCQFGLLRAAEVPTTDTKVLSRGQLRIFVTLTRMKTATDVRPSANGVALARLAGGVAVVAVLVYAYALRIAAGDGNPFNYFGYFTNQTSLIAGLVLIASGLAALTRRQRPEALALMRGIATAYLLVVVLVYNVLVPGTGSAPPWVSFLLHVFFPLVVALDWLLIGDRPPLRWRKLWLLLPYPLAWLTVVLVRGVTDGWVPYGFLLPERRLSSLAAHVVGILGAIGAAGVLVWAASRFRGIHRRETGPSSHAA
jgi:hypothetical protein